MSTLSFFMHYSHVLLAFCLKIYFFHAQKFEFVQSFQMSHDNWLSTTTKSSLLAVEIALELCYKAVRGWTVKSNTDLVKLESIIKIKGSRLNSPWFEKRIKFYFRHDLSCQLRSTYILNFYSRLWYILCTDEWFNLFLDPMS